MNANPENIMYMALELSNTEWKLAFMTTGGVKRFRPVVARNVRALLDEIKLAKQKLGLPPDACVRSCFEAGRDGFWLHWLLTENDVKNIVVDSASIEVDRRQRRAKTDQLDARRLVERLALHHERPHEQRWRVVRVPDRADEDARRPHREIERLTQEKSSHQARLRSLLVMHGVTMKKLSKETLSTARDWKGLELPQHIMAEMLREYERLELCRNQLAHMQKEQEADVLQPATDGGRAANRLIRLKGLGQVTCSVLGYEFFGWRQFSNRRQVGACSGLCGTPYDSGDSRREQGISKAGNRRVRHAMIECAWRWLTWQPQSALACWYQKRFGSGGSRQRRIGIVALARKLLVAFWKYVAFDCVPEGVILKAI